MFWQERAATVKQANLNIEINFLRRWLKLNAIRNMQGPLFTPELFLIVSFAQGKLLIED